MGSRTTTVGITPVLIVMYVLCHLTCVSPAAAGDSPSTSGSNLRHALDKVEELQGQLSKYTEDVDRLTRDNAELRAAVQQLKADGGDKSTDQRVEEAEKYFRREAGSFVLEMGNLRRSELQKERELKACGEELDRVKARLIQEKEESKGTSTTGNKGDSAGGDECSGDVDADKGRPKCLLRVKVDELEDKLRNCEETVKAVRDHCSQDAEDLKRISRQHETLVKSSGNCTEKLADCENMRSYLDFLKSGYEILVPELETDAKKAKEEKEQCEDDAKAAIKGIAAYKLYLAIVGVAVLIALTIKLYGSVSEILRRRLDDAKARDKLAKLERRKAPRDVSRRVKTN